MFQLDIIRDINANKYLLSNETKNALISLKIEFIMINNNLKGTINNLFLLIFKGVTL